MKPAFFFDNSYSAISHKRAAVEQIIQPLSRRVSKTLSCVFAPAKPKHRDTFIGLNLFSCKHGFLTSSLAINTSSVALYLGPNIITKRARSRGIPKPCKSTEHHATNWLFSTWQSRHEPLSVPTRQIRLSHYQREYLCWAARKISNRNKRSIWHRLTTPAFA